MMICALLAVFSSRCAPFLAAKEEKERESASRERRFSPTLSFKRNNLQTRKAKQRNLKRVRFVVVVFKVFYGAFCSVCFAKKSCAIFSKNSSVVFFS